MVPVILAKTANLDMDRLFGVADVKLRCLVKCVCDVVDYLRAGIVRALKLFCFRYQDCQIAHYGREIVTTL